MHKKGETVKKTAVDSPRCLKNITSSFPNKTAQIVPIIEKKEKTDHHTKYELLVNFSWIYYCFGPKLNIKYYLQILTHTPKAQFQPI